MPHSQFQLFFIQLALILTTALFGGALMRRIGLVAVLGEILGGILLGPTVAGALFPEFFSAVFPKDPQVLSAIDPLNRVGMLFFMFAAGLEIKLMHFRQDKRLIASTSLLSFALPFAAGFALVEYCPGSLVETGQPSLLLGLFVGTALSISALPVIARILMDLELVRSRIGMTIMSSAMLNDVAGWCLFTFLLSQAAQNGSTGNEFYGSAYLLGYMLLVILIGRLLMRPLFQRSLFSSWPGGILIMVSALIMITAAGAESLGIHAIFGAFLVGIALGHDENNQNESEKKIYALVETFSLNFFAPLYFVSIGLKINVITHFDIYLALFLTAVACISKIAGAGMGARLGGLRGRDALVVGVGLNARGAVEIILASVAFERQIIDQRLFVALIVMAFSTTLLSAFLLRFLVSGQQKD